MYGKILEAGVSTGLSAIKTITDHWSNPNARADSLISYTRNLRVEPVALIDNDCLYSDMLPEVMQSLLSQFSGYYLQAVAISATVGKINVMRHLEMLNPNRDPRQHAATGMARAQSAGLMLAMESYKHRLPVPGDPRIAMEQQLAMEALDEDEKDRMAREKHQFASDKNDREFVDHVRSSERANAKQNLDEARFRFDTETIYAKRDMDEKKLRQEAEEAQRNYEFNKEKFGHDKAMQMARMELEKKGLALKEAEAERAASAYEIGIGRDTLQTIKELTNLSVGKMLSVEITDGANKATVPISVRIMASTLPTQNLVHILSLGNENKSWKERYHAWKAGRLEFIKDLVLCQDLIDAHRKNLMNDKDGIYTNLVARNRSNQLSSIVSGNPSVAAASNLVVVSRDTIAQLELKLHGSMKDFKVRQKVFNETSIMIMAVVDKQWDRVTFYHRGIPEASECSIRDLKVSNKGNGPDVSDILKAYQLGHAPSL